MGRTHVSSRVGRAGVAVTDFLTAQHRAQVRDARDHIPAVTAREYPCPECSRPMVGAPVWDAKAQEALVGAVCTVCDNAYRIVWWAT